MILEFRIRNFRSFGEETALSLVASGDKELLESNTIDTKISSVPRVVRSAVIYGANASGKTNLLRGLQLMRGVVLESVTLQPGQQFNVQPFRLSDTLKNEPTLFEISIALDGVRYQYGFEFTADRIVGEWLLVYQKAKPQHWFERHFDIKSNQEIFEFGPSLKGQRDAWKKATRENALFLSTAVQFNSEQLRPLYQWFAESFVVWEEINHMPDDFSTKMLEQPEGRSTMTALLRSADIAIRSVSAVQRKGLLQRVSFDASSGRSSLHKEERDLLVPVFRHEAGGIIADFEYQDESRGTQKLFALAGPLIDIIQNGKTLVVDELDNSLHPLLVRQMIKTFQDPLSNHRNAQLIFSTHDTTLLDKDLLRRDQVWLAEKKQDQSSELVPLSEFSPRKGEAFEKNYLGGRYGGVPILGDNLVIRDLNSND